MKMLNEYYAKLVERMSNGCEIKIKVAEIDYFIEQLKKDGLRVFVPENLDTTKHYLYINSLYGDGHLYIDHDSVVPGSMVIDFQI